MPRETAPSRASQLPGQTIVLDAGELHRRLAADLAGAIREVVTARGRAHLALSGGGSPEPVYRVLAGDDGTARGDVPWSALHVWLVDERRVPADDPRANLRMLRAALGRHAERIEALDATAPEAAHTYEERLRAALPDGRLDLVLLGVGADGHTASLFPDSPALDDGGRWVLPNDGPTVVPPPRLTMTAPLLSRARRVWVLATGSAKRGPLAALARLRAEPAAPADAARAARALPIALIRPAAELRFYLDPAAAP
ncbi:MAG: 6-phosphogluconolactonase [Armatimonadota bacterium]|nr:6-phosphogluconolactonase [Armatimonadota bacterium]